MAGLDPRLLKGMANSVDDAALLAGRTYNAHVKNANNAALDDLLNTPGPSRSGNRRKAINAALQGVAHAPAPDQEQEGIDTVGQVLDTANQVNMYAGFVPFGAVLLGIPAAIVKLPGKLFADQSSGRKIFEKAGNVVLAPAEFLENTKLSDVGRVTGTRGIAQSIAQPFASLAAPVIDVFSRVTGLSGWQAKSTLKAAEKAHAEIAKASGEFFAHAMVPDIAHHVELLQKTTAHGRDVAHLHGQWEHVQGAIKGITDHAKASGNKKLLGHITTFGEKAETAAAHYAEHLGWKNVRKTIRELPKHVGKASLTAAMFNTTAVAASALSMFGVAHGFAANLRSLKQMYADLTGEKAQDVSAARVLFGNVPEPVSQARSHMFKQFGPQAIFEAIGGAINLAFVIKRKPSMMMMAGAAAPIGVNLVWNSYIGDSVLPIYQQFRAAHAKGREIPEQFYAEFLRSASQDLKSRAGNDPFVQALAAQYAAVQAGPADIMKEVASGKLMERVEALKAAHAGAQETQVDHAHPEPVSSHVTALHGKAARHEVKRPERQVIGKHTGELAKESQKTLVALEPSPVMGGV